MGQCSFCGQPAFDQMHKRPDFRKRVGQALAGHYADTEPSKHVEQLIYGGFYNTGDKQVLEKTKAANWRHRAELVDQLDDLRVKRLGMRLIFSNAQQYTSKNYQSAARTAIRDRWLTNEPSTPWATMATVEQQLHEIASGETVDQDRINKLRDFYRVRISQIDKL